MVGGQAAGKRKSERSDPSASTEYCACHANHTSAYIQPLGKHQVPSQPRKSHRQGCGDCRGASNNPLESTRYRACHELVGDNQLVAIGW